MPASPIVGGPRTRGRSLSRARGSRAGRRPTRCSSAVAPRRLALTPRAKKRCRTQRVTPSRPLRQVCMMSCIRGSSDTAGINLVTQQYRSLDRRLAALASSFHEGVDAVATDSRGSGRCGRCATRRRPRAVSRSALAPRRGRGRTASRRRRARCGRNSIARAPRPRSRTGSREWRNSAGALGSAELPAERLHRPWMAVVAPNVAQPLVEPREGRFVEGSVPLDALPGARPELLERPVGPRDADDRPVEMAAPGHRLETREYLLRHDRALRPAREIAAGPLPPRARASRPIAHPASLRHIAPSPTAGIIERVCARRWRLGGGTGWGPPRSLAPRARAAVPLRPSARA